MRQAVAGVALALCLAAAAHAGGGFEASIGALDPLRAHLTVTAGDAPKPLLKVTASAGQLAGVIEVVDGRFLTVRLDRPTNGLHLGDLLKFDTAGSGIPRPAAVVVAARPGTISKVDGTQVYVVGPQPDRALPADVRHDGAVVGKVVWLADGDAGLGWHGTWRPGSTGARPSLGDAVVYVATSAPPVAPMPAADVKRPATPSGLEDMVSGDDPNMHVLALLASRGYLTDAGRRQFAGHGVYAYSRREITAVLAEAVGKILDVNHVWPIQSVPPEAAVQLQGLLHDYHAELAAAGVPMAAAQTALGRRVPPGWTWTGDLEAAARLSAGREASTGRIRASAFAALGTRLRLAATVGTEGIAAFPNDHRRGALETAWLDWTVSQHLTLGVGRTSWRLGAGYHDMLWSDLASPLDGLMLDWRTKVFGRPFRLNQHFGYFGDRGDTFATVRRFEWQPLRQLTLAANEALITDRFEQGLATNVMPLYLSRFVSGRQSSGGHGNYLGSLEAAYRFNGQWSWYGEMMMDDFDFSPAPPKTVQRLGWQAGVRFSPKGSRPGTSYRLEGAILPNPGTYTGQQDVGLQWQRGNFLLGHPYGEDAAGYRFSARQRLTSRFDVTCNIEQFHQFRRRPVELRTSLFELSAGYDIRPNLSLGLGVSVNRRSNVGGIMGNNANESALFIETRAGL